MMKRILKYILILVLTLFIVGCSNSNEEQALMLHLSFDEQEGTVAKDTSKNKLNKEIQYVFTNPTFMDSPLEPEWRSSGVKGGSLLFDGYSNYLRYFAEEISLNKSQISISVWVAPRYFEVNTGEYTSIVSQYNSTLNEGVFLGFGDYGYLNFRVGISDRMLTLGSKTPLLRYEWNHVVAVFDGDHGHMSLYLNGQKENETTFFEGSKIENTYLEDLLIARNSEGKSNATATLNMFSGMMDELKIYQTALDEDYIIKQYNELDGENIEFEDIWLQNILTEDIYKPQYHGGPYQHWMNEPHAPFYYEGVYHLFFQFNMMGPYFMNISWGHLVSTDMVNWKPMKEVIIPMENTVAQHGVWSGGATLDGQGNPVLLFTAGNYDATSEGMISTQNIGIARPKDLSDPYLTEWIVDDELAIVQQPGQGIPGEFRDAHVIYEDGIWHLLLTSASTVSNGGTALLYTTTDDSFKNWTYHGQLYEIQNQRGDLGITWELPVMLPIWNEAKTVKKYIFMFSPAPADRADNDVFYFVGAYDKEAGRFVPDESFELEPKLLDYGNNVFTGPSGFVDPVTGKSYVFSIMQDQRKPGDQARAGWAHNVGLAREVYLLENGDAGIRPVDHLDEYKTNIFQANDLNLNDANQQISHIEGDMLHIQVTFSNIEADNFGIKVRKNKTHLEETTIYYDNILNTFGVRTGLSGALNNYQNITGNFYGDLSLVDGKLTLEIYLDRSLLEVFANEDKAISARIYPDKASLAIELFSNNGTVHVESISISQMGSIFK